MTLPYISAICVTYGRVSRLREALACFAQQDYAGQRELIIINSFPQQQLSTAVPNVRMFNCEQRPMSLSACRNLAIANAKGEVIVVWDDDDLYLPHYLTVIGEAYAESEADWVRLNPVWYSEQWKIKKPFSTWINSVSFRKTAWEKVGRYPRDLSVGEDQAMWSRLSKECKGVTVELKPEEIPVIYSWANSVHHISGQGWDKPGRTNAYERSRIELEHRVTRGQEPIGKIVLEPQLEHDPVAMVKEYLATPRPIIKKSSVCIVELGRYGDIVNILPIARHIAEMYDTPHLMVSREFASILEGISYVHPVVVPLRNDQLKEGLKLAHKDFKHVINTQIWGSDWQQERKTSSFNRESWRQAGFWHKFDDHSPKWLPYFDRRDKEREAGVIAKVLTMDKPLLLVNVTHSASSPFPQGQDLFSEIAKRFDQRFTLMNCGSLRLSRIYDILGLMEKSAALVSIDTALLHLAAATGIPIVALVNDKPWQGSEIRGNCVLRLPYAAATAEAVCAAIEKAVTMPNLPIVHEPLAKPPERYLYHVVERHDEKDVPSVPRKQDAWKSWDDLYRTGNVVPCHLWEPYPRNSKETIKDKRVLPYLKDVLSLGMTQAQPDDIIMFTNDDNPLHPELPDIVRLHCALWGCACAQRSEFRKPVPSLEQTPDAIAAQGERHMGRDMFAFTKRWLEANWAELPDFILGASDWDLCLAAMLRLQWGIRSNRQNMEQQIWPCEIPWGYVLHRFHPPRWNAPSNRDAAPSQIYNRRLHKEWAAKHLPELKFYWNNTI